MSIKIGDKIRYLATSEDGEVVDVSNVSPGCVLVRFGESFEYAGQWRRNAEVGLLSGD
jgi:hypothetical protein